MDRPTKGSSPHEPAPETDAVPDRGDVWADALYALREISRKHEDEAVTEPPAFAAPTPEPPAAVAQPAIDETLLALQTLARRYTLPAPIPGDERWPRADDTAEPRHAGYDHAAYEDRGYVGQTHQGPAYQDLPYEDPPYPARQYPDPVYENPAHQDLADEIASYRPSPGARRLTRRSRWGSLALILGSAAVLAILLIGAVSLSRHLFHGRGVGAEPAAPIATGETPATPLEAAPAGPGSSMVASTGTMDLPAIEKAMADCDDQAANDRDGLYFLILPAVSPSRDHARWASKSVGEIGTSITLLPSKDALEGLRDGTLAVYPAPYRFSIIDAATGIPHEWAPATGAAKFVKPDAAAMDGFRVRFSYAEYIGDTPSEFRFPRDKGVCYWVSALLRM